MLTWDSRKVVRDSVRGISELDSSHLVDVYSNIILMSLANKSQGRYSVCFPSLFRLLPQTRGFAVESISISTVTALFRSMGFHHSKKSGDIPRSKFILSSN